MLRRAGQELERYVIGLPVELASSVVAGGITRLAKRYMNDPVELNVSRDEITVEEVEQAYITVDAWDKFRLLHMLLKREKPKLAIVFCNTKRACAKAAMSRSDRWGWPVG